MAKIDWTKKATDLVNLVRGLNPWPVAFFVYNGEPVKVFRATAINGQAKPGSVVYCDAQKGLVIGCGEGLLQLDELQLPDPMPRMRNCDFCIGKPGSMNRTLFFFSSRWQHAMKAPKLPATEPTVGMQARGLMSMSRKAFTKRLAASFSSGMPAAAGYWLLAPASKAFFSASMPNVLQGKDYLLFRFDVQQEKLAGYG